MNTIAAIHVLKGLLRLSEDDYRALLQEVVGVRSCSAMSAVQLAVVYTHFDKLALRMGVQKPAPKAGAGQARPGRALDNPQQRKLRAMWWALADVGGVDRPDSPTAAAKALEVWAKRQLNGTALGPLDALRFASTPQLNKLIEELKAWGWRVGAKIQ
jgi:Protein of unknown function (DUF1018)